MSAGDGVSREVPKRRDCRFYLLPEMGSQTNWTSLLSHNRACMRPSKTDRTYQTLIVRNYWYAILYIYYIYIIYI